MSLEITVDNFEQEVIESDIPVMVDFWAAWCGPCRMVSPIVDKIGETYEGRAKVCKINVDEQGALAERFRVLSIPTIYIFKDGEIVEKLVGARPYEELTEALERHL
ncbi:MAG: thioredoxin [Clostridiaceae bacterium]|nr:thioredoxin [Bacillota bacterium]NLN52288.1 thioredoxin [Clostridiaceae bacterium]